MSKKGSIFTDSLALTSYGVAALGAAFTVAAAAPGSSIGVYAINAVGGAVAGFAGSLFFGTIGMAVSAFAETARAGLGALFTGKMNPRMGVVKAGAVLSAMALPATYAYYQIDQGDMNIRANSPLERILDQAGIEPGAKKLPSPSA